MATYWEHIKMFLLKTEKSSQLFSEWVAELLCSVGISERKIFLKNTLKFYSPISNKWGEFLKYRVSNQEGISEYTRRIF